MLWKAINSVRRGAAMVEFMLVMAALAAVSITVLSLVRELLAPYMQGILDEVVRTYP